MRRRYDLLAAATVVVAVTAFFIWQFFGLQHAAEARFSRAMHLRTWVTESAAVMVNHEQTAFRGCVALINGRYRFDRPFLIPAAGEMEPEEVRLSLTGFAADDRLLDWRRHRPSRLEVYCDEYADLTSEHGRQLLSNPHALPWVFGPARWVGRLQPPPPPPTAH